MTITEKLKELATNNGVLPYVFGSLYQINVMMDKLHRQRQYPIAVALQPVDGTLTISEGYDLRGLDTEHVIIGYADSIKLDDDPEQVQTKVDALKRRCLNLLNDISTCGHFGWVSEAMYSVMFDELDANMVIVLMDFNVREAEGICL